MPLTLRVESSAFGMNGSIPIQYTCEGDDIAPPLSWSAPPDGTQSMAILVEDPDAPDPASPQRTFAHWIVTGLPPTVTSLRGASTPLPEGTQLGTNDFGKQAWNGPCPPIGRHRYFFKVYALDIPLHGRSISRQELLAAMKGHILAQGELVGTYEKLAERRKAEQADERTTHGRR